MCLARAAAKIVGARHSGSYLPRLICNPRFLAFIHFGMDLIMFSFIPTSRNATASIRNCLDHGNYSYLRKFVAAQTKANVVRHTPAYAPPSRFNLIGRAVVACSGATTRRARACARLNDFVVLGRTVKAPKWLRFGSPKQYDYGRDVAIDKFKSAYTKCRSEDQQASMLAVLSDSALQELEQWGFAGGLAASEDDVGALLKTGIKLQLSSSVTITQLEDAIKLEWSRRRSGLQSS